MQSDYPLLPPQGPNTGSNNDNASTDDDSAAREPIDRLTNAMLGRMSMGLSPAALLLAYLDWIIHLGMAPGKQAQLLQKALRKALRLNMYSMHSLQGESEPCIKPLPQDHRFDHPDWQQWPYNL
ncbi:MAG: poly-beta-hydroxybutyrate polymerase N-terminal domain-containing protein, partial [Gammaproteobacteria bacterium]